MFNLKEKFEFLEDGVDFPFYNDVPKLSTWEWCLLAIAVIFFAILTTSSGIPKGIHSLLYCLVMLIPALYICKGNYSLFFKKPKRGNIKTIILCFFGYMIYSLIVLSILSSLGYVLSRNASLSWNIDLMYFVTLFIQLIGEEFFKIFVLLIVMYLVYRFTKNRGMSIYTGIVATLLVFGLAHCTAYGGKILQILLIQGIGAIFNLYAYMKTKNFVVSYILHIIIDFSSTLLASFAQMQ